ncbi:MAG: DUF2281 domain-containing protein [Chloroflexi bacterium]|nr:DUF2281 domain-containing protein [Chloroflexota bacterium]
MTLAEKIIDKMQSLPEQKQAEVLDFVDFLEHKMVMEENREWAQFSLTAAMRDIEEEEDLYSLDDLNWILG